MATAAAASAKVDDKAAEASRKSEARALPSQSMSVSVPNLSSNTEQAAATLLESFAAVTRRNLNSGSSNNKTVSSSQVATSLVRMALASSGSQGN